MGIESPAGSVFMAAKSISAAEYIRRAGEFVLVDVRTKEEWEEGHEENALHVPLGEVVAKMWDLPKRPLAIICRSGARSAHACMLLSGAGFDVCNIEGGMNALMRCKR